MAFSPDSQLIATASSDNTAKIWEVETGLLLCTLAGHTKGLAGIAFSPDGKSVATASADHSVRLWNISTGSEFRRFEGHTNTVTAVQFSPDGKLLLSASEDFSVRLWDVSSGVTLRRLGSELGRTSLAFSSDGHFALTAGGFDATGRLWDVQTGRELRTFDDASAIGMAPDGKTIATARSKGAMNSVVRLWDFDSRKEVGRLSGKDVFDVSTIAFTGDGRNILTTTQGASAILWDVQTKKEIRRFDPTSLRNLRAAALSPDGRYVVTGGEDNIAELWGASSGKRIRSFEAYPVTRINSFAIAADGRYLVIIDGDDKVRLWDVATSKQVALAAEDVKAAVFSSNGNSLFTGHVDGKVLVWNTSTRKPMRSFEGHGEGVESMAMATSPDGRLLMTSTSDSTARVWEVATGKEIRRIRDTNEVAFSPDGRMFAGLNTSMKVSVWDTGTGSKILTLAGNADPGDIDKTMSFSTDGRNMLVRHSTSILRLLSVATGKEIRRFDGHSKQIKSAVFSQDGRTVLTASEDHTARLWNVSTGREIRLLLHPAPLIQAAFWPGEHLIVTADDEGVLTFWDASSGDEVASFVAFKDQSWAVISANGRYDASDPDNAPGLHGVSGLQSIRLNEFKDRFYAPGMLTKLSKPETAAELASVPGAAMYPDVKLELPSGASTRMRIVLTNRGGGIGPVAIKLNGKAIPEELQIGKSSPDAKEATVFVDLNVAPNQKAGNYQVEVIASDAGSIHAGPPVSATWRSVALIEPVRLVAQRGSAHVVTVSALSPDGNYALTVVGASVLLWDVQTGRPIREFSIGSNQIHSLAYSPDGRHMVVSATSSSDGHWNHTARVWDITSGRVVQQFDSKAEIRAVAFSPDGSLVFTGGLGGMILWEVASGTKRWETNEEPLLSTSAAFSLDKRLLAIGGLKTAQIWDASSGRLISKLPVQSSEVESISFSADGSRLLTGDEAGSVQLWDTKEVNNIKEIRHFEGQPNLPRASAAMSPDGQFVLAISQRKLIRIWEASTGRLIRELDGGVDVGILATLALSGDGRRLLTNVRGGCSVWDVSSGKLVQTLKGRSVAAHSLSFSADGQYLLAGFRDSALLWDMISGTPVQRFVAPGITSVALSQDGRFALTGGHAARMWETSTGRELRQFATSGSAVTAVSFSSDGLHVLTGSSDNVARIWDAQTGVQLKLKEFSGNKSAAIAPMAFSPDEKYVVTGSQDTNTNTVESSALIWDATSGKQLHRITHDNGIQSVQFSPNGRYLLTGSADHTARLWETDTGAEVRRFEGGGGSFVNSVAIAKFDSSSIADSPLGLHVLTGNSDGTVCLYDVLSGKELRRFQGHSEGISAVIFSPDGKYVVSASDDQTVRIWTMDAWKPVVSQIVFEDGTWSVVAPDGRYDTNNLDGSAALSWVVEDAPMKPLPLEIFMRDYYEPGLVSRVLGAKPPLPDIPSVNELNRNQPFIGKITVEPEPGRPAFVNVNVEIASIAGECLKGTGHVVCESGVYDLRLYRDGQFVAQSPRAGTSARTEGPSRKPEEMQQWRSTSLVRDQDGRSILAAGGSRRISFHDIRLPQRADVSEVGFEAYAFNADRVKSDTAKPTVFALLRERAPIKRRAFIITMGVDVTSDPNWRLAFAPNGAREVDALLKEKLSGTYETISAPLISAYSGSVFDVVATKDNLRTVFRVLTGNATAADHKLFPQLMQTTPDDLLVVYVASHGYAQPDGLFHIVPSDIGEPDGVSENLLNRCLTNHEQSKSCDAARRFLQHSISTDELTQWLQEVDTGQMVLILDSCHSASVTGSEFKPGPFGDRGFGQLSFDKRMQILAATQADSFAWGSLELGDRSLLTMALTNQQWQDDDSFDLKRWLSNAQALVPVLHRRYIQDGHEVQYPRLFDFSERKSLHY